MFCHVPVICTCCAGHVILIELPHSTMNRYDFLSFTDEQSQGQTNHIILRSLWNWQPSCSKTQLLSFSTVILSTYLLCYKLKYLAKEILCVLIRIWGCGSLHSSYRNNEILISE